MVTDSSLKHTPPHPSTPKRAFSEIGGDIVILVDGQSFLLHKIILAARCGRIRKLVTDFNITNLELVSVPGGPQTFELAAKFCYGVNFEVTTANVARLRCIAEYLEMTEVHKEDNLVARTERFLDDIVEPSLEMSIEVLCSCENLLPMAEDVGIIDRCVNAVAINASKAQMSSGLAYPYGNSDSGKLDIDCQDWWIEEICSLRIDLYQKVISAMRKEGVRSNSIITSLMQYAQTSLKGIGQRQILDSGTPLGDKQRKIVEALISLLISEKAASFPANFLFGMLRMAIIADAPLICRLELEKRIGFQLDTVTLDDLLIPSLHGDLIFEVDTIQRILMNFLRRIEEEENEEHFQGDYECEPPGNLNHTSVLKVGRLIDGYFAEIAPDPNLKLQKFMAIIETLPDYARVIDDGLYRAIDIYLKAHPSLSDSECKKLCKLIDCQKLSQEASNHAAQNERLPVQMVIRVLYFEQLRLKSSLSDSSGEGFSQRMLSSSGIPSAAVSPRDNYASLKRENRELKLEISRMRVRLSDLEKEQEYMKQGIRDSKSSQCSHQGKAFFAAVSRRFGRMGIFGAGSGSQLQRCAGNTIASDSKKQAYRKQAK